MPEGKRVTLTIKASEAEAAAIDAARGAAQPLVEVDQAPDGQQVATSQGPAEVVTGIRDLTAGEMFALDLNATALSEERGC